MTLLSAKVDFVQTTLAGVRGILGGLDYLSGLRHPEGRYGHWGMSRVHGEEAAQQAMAEAHRLLFLQILRTPLHRLLDDLAQTTAAQQVEMEAFLACLRDRGVGLLPPQLGGGSERHFNSVVAALWALVRSRGASRPDA